MYFTDSFVANTSLVFFDGNTDGLAGRGQG